MSSIEREFTQQVDDIVLKATPEVLSKLAEIDKKSQLSQMTFYDAYLQLSDEDKKQILVATRAEKIE